MQGVNLEYVILDKDLDLSGANLSGISIYKSDMPEVKLVGANLSGAKLQKVNLSESCLQDADLHGAKLFEVGLSFSNLRKANLSQVEGFEVCFFASDLSYANLTNAEFSGDFRRCNLTRANMENSFLGYLDLSLANLFETNIDLAEIGEEVIFSGAIMPDGTIYE